MFSGIISHRPRLSREPPCTILLFLSAKHKVCYMASTYIEYSHTDNRGSTKDSRLLQNKFLRSAIARLLLLSIARRANVDDEVEEDKAKRKTSWSFRAGDRPSRASLPIQTSAYLRSNRRPTARGTCRNLGTSRSRSRSNDSAK